ncbi:MAG: hypothetical protein ACT4OE_03635 [Sphingosinicella sp.]
MARPRPTAAQVGMIAGGAAAGAAAAFTLGIGGAIGGAIIGVGAALGAIPYSRAVQQAKKRDEAGSAGGN